MATQIKIKRGLNTNINSTQLLVGEPAFATDVGKLYIGNSASKTLINPIDKPNGINTTNYYSKVKVNDYGQVVAQDVLSAADMPTIPNTKVTGLGTLSTVNSGTSSGQVPTLDANGKFPVSAIPKQDGNFITAHYSGDVITTASANGYIPFNNNYSAGSMFNFNTGGTVTISQTGVYLFCYHVTTSSLTLSTALNSNSGNYIGSIATSTASIVQSFCATSISIVKQITTANEIVGVKNIGSTSVIILANQSAMSILKIADL